MPLRNVSRSYAGRRICGTPYVGLPGSTIPSTGASGVPPAYPLLTFPADNDVQIRIRLGTIPSGLTLFMYEDTSFVASGVDGSYDVHFTLERNGVSNPTDYYFTITFGGGVVHVAVGTLAAGSATVAGTAARTRAHAASGALAAGAAVVSGTARRPAGHIAAGALAAAAAQLAGAASHTKTHIAAGDLVAGFAGMSGAASSLADGERVPTTYPLAGQAEDFPLAGQAQTFPLQ